MFSRFFRDTTTLQFSLWTYVLCAIVISLYALIAIAFLHANHEDFIRLALVSGLAAGVLVSALSFEPTLVAIILSCNAYLVLYVDPSGFISQRDAIFSTDVASLAVGLIVTGVGKMIVSEFRGWKKTHANGKMGNTRHASTL